MAPKLINRGFSIIRTEQLRKTNSEKSQKFFRTTVLRRKSSKRLKVSPRQKRPPNFRGRGQIFCEFSAPGKAEDFPERGKADRL